jgi:uncharacterized membrane protein
MDTIHRNGLTAKIIKKQRSQIWHHHPTIRLLVKGLVISLPLIILLLIVSLVLSLVFGFISPLSKMISPGTEEPHWIYHIFSISLLLGLFYIIGVTAKNKRRKSYFLAFENDYLNQVPLYRTTRELVQQFSGLKKVPFSQVVLDDPIDNGVLMTGFVTEKVTDNIYTVFVPTAPNPTNGNIYHVPKSRLKLISTPSESAMRTVVGMGTGSTCLFKEKEVEVIKEKVVLT